MKASERWGLCTLNSRTCAPAARARSRIGLTNAKLSSWRATLPLPLALGTGVCVMPLTPFVQHCADIKRQRWAAMRRRRLHIVSAVNDSSASFCCAADGLEDLLVGLRIDPD